MISLTIQSLTTFLRFDDKKLEEDYNAYFQIDVKQKFRIFIFIECVYAISYIVNDILNFFYSTESDLKEPFWLSMHILGIIVLFFIFLTLSILIIKNKLSSINKIDPIILIMGLAMIFIFDNPFMKNSNYKTCIRDIGYQAFWGGYAVQFHNVIICHLFNRWIYKNIYFSTTSTYFYFFKRQIIDDQLVGAKILGFIIAYGIMVYFFEKVNRLNYLQLCKLIEKDKMWKDITDSLPEGILLVKKNSKPLYLNRKLKGYLDKPEKSKKENGDKQQIKKQNQQEKEPKKIKLQQQDQTTDDTYNLINFFDKIVNLKLRNSLEDLKARYKKSLSIYRKPDRSRSTFVIETISDSFIDQKVNKYHPLIEGSTLNEVMKFTSQIDDSQYIFSMDDFITFDSSFQEKSLEIKAKNIKFDGEVVLLMIFVDTTHRDLIAKLEQNDKYKNIVLSTVSHELRTPLNSAISMIQTAIDSNNVSELDKNELLHLSLRSLNMLASLINDILDYSQIQANKLNLIFQNVDLRQVIYDAIALFEIQCKKKGIELKVDIEKTVPNFIRTDPNRLTQIILNLLSNAIKFTKKGYVKISVKWDDLKYGKTRISVEDTGIGIKPEEISKLFQEFGKIDLGENAKMNPTGCGLGLSISHKLAMRLGGDDSDGIKVESVFGKGSIFSFSLEDNQVKKVSMEAESVLDSNIHSDNCDIPIFIRRKSSLMSLKPKNKNDPYFRGLSNKNRRKSMNKMDDYQDSNNQLDLDEGNPKDILNNKPMKFLKLNDRINNKSSPCAANRPVLLNNNSAINCCDRRNALPNKPRLLIIDDDAINLYSFTLITKNLDYECDTVNSVEEGFNLLQKENLCKSHPPYDIIFMDFNMPDIDGLTATSIIKNMILKEELPSIFIIGCTAFLCEEIKEKGIKSGMDYVVEKPITKEKVYNLVKMFKKV